MTDKEKKDIEKDLNQDFGAEDTGTETGTEAKETIEQAEAEAVDTEPAGEEFAAEEPAAEETIAEEAAAEESTGKASWADKRAGKKAEKAARKDAEAKIAAQLSAKDAQIADLNDRLRRNLAEFDNFRKRSEAEKAARFDMGKKDVIEHILPVVDNFERGLASLSEEQKADPFADGMEKTYRQLMTILDELGVKPIPAVGETFNPDLHNAVMHVDDDSQPENVIVEEFQKGYKLGDSVVRYSMVKVAN